MAILNVNTSKRFSDEQQVRSWQVIVSWLVDQAQRYRIVCEPNKKGSSQIISLLTPHASARDEVEKKVKSKIADALFKVTSKAYRTPDVVFVGVPDRALSDILLHGPLEDASVSADIAPCSEVMLSRHEEVLFTSFDYGRFQTLYVTTGEANELRNLLERSGLPPDILVEQKESGASKAPWFFAGRVDKA